MLALIVSREGDHAPPEAHGPFETKVEAEEYGRAYREYHDIPGHDQDLPTEDEQTDWEADGWHFHIQPLLREFCEVND